MSSSKGVHILVFPFPAQGHILPILDLTHQLAIRGLTITILLTPKNLPILNPLLSQHPSSIQTLVFPFPDHPSLPPGVENVRDVGNSGNVHIINALGKLHGPIIHWFQSHPSPPVALISDFFLGWTHHLCSRLNIPRIIFYSSGAFAVSVFDRLWHGGDALRSLPVVDFPDLPGSPTFAHDHLPSVFRQYRASDPDWEFVADGMCVNISSWAAVFNTFEAFEADYLDHLRNNNRDRRVFSVGPLSLLGPTNQVENTGNGNGVMGWLDGCTDSSVVYVCFGSQKLLKKAQMEALASGLEQSGVRFVWAVKPITAQQEAKGYGTVPDGFEDRVSGRGMVIKGWAPQVSILNHRAVGGFLSHCGWNSTLEGLVAGAMILCWPMEAEQFVNARLLVEYLKVGVLVCEGADAVPDPVELGRVIAEPMLGGLCERVIKAKELSDKALEAVKPGGSSLRDLDELVKELTLLKATQQP